MLHMIGVCFLGLWILKSIIDKGPAPQYYLSAATLIFTEASCSLSTHLVYLQDNPPFAGWA